jgi:transcriptional regulator with XRE-family HTH domain
MAPDTYGEVLARNIRSTRVRADIGQENLAVRMRSLGFAAWIRQTVGAVERNRRRPTAEEMLGLAYALNTTVERLMTPQPEDGQIDLPSGATLPWESVRYTVSGGDPVNEEPGRRDRHVSFHRGVRWDGDTMTRVPTRYDQDGGA